MKIGNHSFQTSNLEKVLFPKSGITKGDVIEYYKKIGSAILPFLKNRPVAMERYPDGIDAEGFYQKEIPDYFPDWINRTRVERNSEEAIEMVIVDNEATLPYLANQGCISLHGLLATSEDENKPDKLIFDLDPPEDGFELVLECARELNKYFQEQNGMNAFVMTTGSKGLHVVIPLDQEKNFDEIRNYAKDVADEIASEHPDKFTTEVRKNKRNGRLFIDYLRNSHGQHSIVPYSLRAIESAPIATPLRWDEVAELESAQKYTLKNIFRRMAQINAPWK